MHENRETSETPAVQADGRSAGEGPGRTARVYVCEESHRGIVPMNHSNQDGTALAESEEGGCGSRRTLSHSTRTRLSAGLRVPHGWASVRRSRLGSAVTDLREEPDALMSARPGLCGVVP